MNGFDLLYCMIERSILLLMTFRFFGVISDGRCFRMNCFSFSNFSLLEQYLDAHAGCDPLGLPHFRMILCILDNDKFCFSVPSCFAKFFPLVYVVCSLRLSLRMRMYSWFLLLYVLFTLLFMILHWYVLCVYLTVVVILNVWGLFLGGKLRMGWMFVVLNVLYDSFWDVAVNSSHY